MKKKPMKTKVKPAPKPKRKRKQPSLFKRGAIPRLPKQHAATKHKDSEAVSNELNGDDDI